MQGDIGKDTSSRNVVRWPKSVKADNDQEPMVSSAAMRSVSSLMHSERRTRLAEAVTGDRSDETRCSSHSAALVLNTFAGHNPPVAPIVQVFVHGPDVPSATRRIAAPRVAPGFRAERSTARAA